MIRTRSPNLIECRAGSRFKSMFGALTDLSSDSITCLCFNGDQGREPEIWPLPGPNGALLENPPRLVSMYVCWIRMVGDPKGEDHTRYV